MPAAEGGAAVGIEPNAPKPSLSKLKRIRQEEDQTSAESVKSNS